MTRPALHSAERLEAGLYRVGRLLVRKVAKDAWVVTGPSSPDPIPICGQVEFTTLQDALGAIGRAVEERNSQPKGSTA